MKELLFLFLLTTIIYPTSYAWSDIYTWKDADGKTHFSDKAPTNKKKQPQTLKLNEKNFSKNFSSQRVKKKKIIPLPKKSSKSVFLESVFSRINGSDELTKVGYIYQGNQCNIKNKVMMPAGRLKKLRDSAEFEFNKKMQEANYTLPNIDHTLFASSLENTSIDYSFAAIITDMKVEGCSDDKSQDYKVYIKVEWKVFDNLKRKVVFTSESEGSFFGSLKNVSTRHSFTYLAISKAFSVATHNLLAEQELSTLMKDELENENPKATKSSQPITINTSNPIQFSNRLQAVRSIKEATLVVRTTSGHGSGFIIDKTGKAITNAHVIASHNNVIVIYNNKEYKARVIRRNSERDIALIQITPPDPMEFKHVHIASKDPEPGEDIMIIGAPLYEKLSHSVTRGIISAKRKLDDNQIYLQTDAAINPGNSGGPAFNDNGKIVGIAVSGIFSQNGASKNINFLIPITEGFNAINLQVEP